MRAIILSAGKGSRMYPLTANTPKCLIDIGEGKTILENQLDVLRESGIDDVYIVAGYRIEQVRAKISGCNLGNMRVQVLHNPFYATSNNIVSLWLALLVTDGPCISINGDDVFKPSVIKALLATKGDVVMTIDRKEHYDADDMLVITDDGLVRSVGKDLDEKRANGESVGIIKYSPRGLERLKIILDLMLREEKNHQIFYLAALQEIMDQGFSVASCEIEPHDWAEIDFHPDVNDVREKIDVFIQKVM